jgi:hypothetical protein
LDTNVHPRKFDKLKKRLQRVVSEGSLSQHRELIETTIIELGIEPIDFAAALLQMTHPHLFQQPANAEEAPPPHKPQPSHYRNIRYRLDVGSKHQVSEEEILEVVIEESGVDKKRIGRLEMRDNYTLIDLPEGMPADIFQLLTEASVRGHKLNIKRLKPNRRRPNREFNKSQQQRVIVNGLLTTSV